MDHEPDEDPIDDVPSNEDEDPSTGDDARAEEDGASSPGDDAHTEEEEESASAETAVEGREESGTASAGKERGHRILRATLVASCALMALAYGVNCYLNVTAADEVRELCWAEDERLRFAIGEATEDRLPALDWMISLYRARRRYVRELCDDTVLQLAWWRWNLGRRIEADISDTTQQDIARTLARASLSCEHEIDTMEGLFERELDARGSSTQVRGRAEEMIRGQLESCLELRGAVRESRPGFWPPLRADGQMAVPGRLHQMMPRALEALTQQQAEAE